MDIYYYLYTMIRGIIYKYTSPSNKHYIGQTIHPKSRKIEHKHNSKVLKTKFYNAIKKYGFDSFEFSVLYETPLLPKEEVIKLLNEKEQYYIKMFDSFNNGYNHDEGGKARIGFKHKLETIELYKKQRSFVPQEIRDKISKSNKGKIIPEEVRKKISEGNKGKGMSDKNKKLVSLQKSKPVLQYTLEGIFIKEWKSATQAAKELGLKNAPISKVCKQNKGTVYGYIWKFKSLLDNEKQ